MQLKNRPSKQIKRLQWTYQLQLSKCYLKLYYIHLYKPMFKLNFSVC